MPIYINSIYKSNYRVKKLSINYLTEYKVVYMISKVKKKVLYLFVCFGYVLKQ